MKYKINIKGKTAINQKGELPSLEELQTVTHKVAMKHLQHNAKRIQNTLQGKFDLGIKESIKIEPTETGIQLVPINEDIEREMKLIEYGNNETEPKANWRITKAIEETKIRHLGNAIKTEIVTELKKK